MDVDIKVLRAFVEVARCQSFTRAAARLHLSQPRLSVKVQQLEEELGFALFYRGTRSVELSAEGSRLYDQAIRFLRHVDDMSATMAEMRSGRAYNLLIGASPLFTAERWKILERLNAQVPKVRPRVIVGPSAELFEHLREGRIDLAFAVGEVPADLQSLPLWQSRYGLILPATSPLAALDEIAPEDMADSRLHTFPREALPVLHARLSALLTPHRVEMLDLIEGCSEAIVHHVQLTGSAVLSPKWWRSPACEPAGLVFRPLRDVDEAETFCLVRARTVLPHAPRDLWRIVADEQARSEPGPLRLEPVLASARSPSEMVARVQ